MTSPTHGSPIPPCTRHGTPRPDCDACLAEVSSASPPVGGATREPTCECGHAQSDHEQGVYMCAFAVPDCNCNAFRRSPVEAGAPGSEELPKAGERGYQGCPFCPLGVCLGREHHPSFAAGAPEEATKVHARHGRLSALLNDLGCEERPGSRSIRGEIHGLLSEVEARVSQLEATVAETRGAVSEYDYLRRECPDDAEREAGWRLVLAAMGMATPEHPEADAVDFSRSTTSQSVAGEALTPPPSGSVAP